MGILLGVLPLIILTAVLKRYYQSGSSALTNFSETLFYTYFFITGILFASSQLFWENLTKQRRFHFVAFIISSLLFYSYYFVPNDSIEPYKQRRSLRYLVWLMLFVRMMLCFDLVRIWSSIPQ
jgi:ABC-type transport system involved in cytochrome c biogenesis permease subunit